MNEEQLSSIWNFLNTADAACGTGYRTDSEKPDLALTAAQLSKKRKAAVLVHLETPSTPAEIDLLDKMLSSIGLIRGENTEMCYGNLDEALIASPLPLVFALSGDSDIDQWRGAFENRAGKSILWSYSPTALIANPALKRPAWEDLKLLRTRIPPETLHSGETARG